MITALVTGLVAVWVFDLSTLEGLIVGSAVAATDSAAIFAVLRGSHLRRRLARPGILNQDTDVHRPGPQWGRRGEDGDLVVTLPL